MPILTHDEAVPQLVARLNEGVSCYVVPPSVNMGEAFLAYVRASVQRVEIAHDRQRMLRLLNGAEVRVLSPNRDSHMGLAGRPTYQLLFQRNSSGQDLLDYEELGPLLSSRSVPEPISYVPDLVILSRFERELLIP